MTDYDPALLQAQLDDLRAQHDQAVAWLRRIDIESISDRERIDNVEQQVADIYGTDDTPQAGRPEWRYANVYDWVEQWYVIHFARHVDNGTRWCARWHEHPEALFRLSALWRSWETHRTDFKRGISVWLRDFGDAQFKELTNPEGTFRSCNRHKHHLPEPLPWTAHTGEETS